MAAEGGGDGMPKYDFPLITEGDGETPDVGGSLVRTEAVSEDRSDWDFDRQGWSFTPGEGIGTAYLELKRPTEDRILLKATFEFADRDIVIVQGVVRTDPAGKVGGGRLTYVAGTGKFVGRKGQVTLEVFNPWRWS